MSINGYGMNLREYYIGKAFQGAMANQFMLIRNGQDAEAMIDGIILSIDILFQKMAQREIIDE